MPFPAVNPALQAALADQGYAEPTPVQAAILDQPGEHDLLVSAQTGSGKTVGYGLAMASTLLGEAQRFGETGAPLALIIAPTRELALQVSRELVWLYGKTGARVVTCVGGMDARQEQRALASGCHIVVGTPGRLRDHLERGHLDLTLLRVVVLDEADEMLDLGFREDLEAILESAPAERRTLLFSATIARPIVALARRFQRDALRIDTTSHDQPHGDIEYRVIQVAPNERELAVVNVLRFFEAPGALVFCSTREAVRHLYGSLRERGFDAVALSGELTQKERTDALHALRHGHARVCVATDVAARGLDLPDLGLVIHAELPQNRAALLHRSGRTGRAGRKGVSVVLAPYNQRRRAEQLLASASIEAEWGGPPAADEIRARDQQRLLDDPILTEPLSEDDLKLARRVLQDRSPEQVAAALVRLHRSRLPAPEELFDLPRPREPRPVRDGGERPAYGERPDMTGGTWFRLNIGRGQNADPKWLLPLICRVGHVTKKDIGQIRIFDRETKFEITRDAEPGFSAAVAASTEAKVRIEKTTPPAPRDASGPRPRPAQAERPERPERPYRPREDRPETGERPARGERPERPKGKAPFKPKAGKPPFRAGAKPGGKPPRRSNAERRS